jgi:hypothetical protein
MLTSAELIVQESAKVNPVENPAPMGMGYVMAKGIVTQEEIAFWTVVSQIQG